MDYKYIEQLLDRYWRCETTLEEEQILRAFFQQEEIPAQLKQYQPLFSYEAVEKQVDVLGDDFDKKVLDIIGEEQPAKVITLRQRLMPLFRAAAIVAIFLTLGNAIQVSLNDDSNDAVPMAGIDKSTDGPSVAAAQTDTVKLELQQPTTDVASPIKQ
jgi:hypothetical protein